MPCEDSHRLRSFRVDLHSQPVAMICCSLVFLDTCVYCNASSIFLLSKSRQSLRFTALPRWHEHPAVTCLGTLNPIRVNNISSHNICKRRVSMCFECVFDGMVFLCYTLSANESSEPPMMIPGSTRSRSIVTSHLKNNLAGLKVLAIQFEQRCFFSGFITFLPVYIHLVQHLLPKDQVVLGYFLFEQNA